MSSPDYLVYGGDVRVPGLAFGLQKLSAFGGQMVIASARPGSGFNPSALDQGAIFETAQNRIQRSDAEAKAPLRSRFDQLSDFVAVAIAFFKKSEYQQLRAAFLKLAIEHEQETILVRSILSSRTIGSASTNVEIADYGATHLKLAASSMLPWPE
jgi:hypothetical protein